MNFYLIENREKPQTLNRNPILVTGDVNLEQNSWQPNTNLFLKIFKIRNIQKLYNYQVVGFSRPKDA